MSDEPTSGSITEQLSLASRMHKIASARNGIDLRKALRRGVEYLKHHPKAHIVLSAMGTVHFDAGHFFHSRGDYGQAKSNYKRAREYWNETIEIHQDDWRAQEGLARLDLQRSIALRDHRQFKEAEDALTTAQAHIDRAIEVSQSNDETKKFAKFLVQFKGRLALERDDVQEATNLAEKVIEMTEDKHGWSLIGAASKLSVPKISEAQRRRVLHQLDEDLGYIPNPSRAAEGPHRFRHRESDAGERGR